MKAVKYVRVSTKEQSTARQEDKNLKLYTDKCSGTIAFKERPQAKKLLKDVNKGLIKTVHVHSIDRLGRNAKDIQDTIHLLTESKVNVHSDDLGMSSLKNDGSINTIFKLITDLMANIAQLEYDSITQRRREGIAAAKARGVYSKSRHRQPLPTKDLLNKHQGIVNCLQAGMSLEKTKAATGKSIPTITKVKRALRETKQL